MVTRKITLFLFLLVASFSSAPADKVGTKFNQATVTKQKEVLDIDYDQICTIESQNRDSIVSKEGAIGPMQITSSAVREWNQCHLDEKYKTKDLYKRAVNLKIGKWLFSERIPQYLIFAKIPVKLNYKLIAYNWGPTNFVKWYKKGHNYSKLPDETRDYLAKYWEKY